MLNKTIKFFLENKLVTFLVVLALIVAGIAFAPFNWKDTLIPRDPIPVDAIPDIGENQQIVYTEWAGRSPQDIEDQISYPLTTSLLGIPGVKTIRSQSIFGLSSIYIIFNDDIDFYWGRTRILEKLNSLPAGLLPAEVKPALGPDATALGQVYWYTIEGEDKDGNPTGGWDPQEIRTVQDFFVRYALTSVPGVSEVASIGGFIKEYQIDINPDALKAYKIGIGDIVKAVKNSNLDIGARTIEINKAEYLVRALGYIKSLKDLEESVVAVRNFKPVRLKDVANIAYGPATRRGGLDKGGSEAVGGVVVARYGSNPLAVINSVKDKIKQIEPGMPQKKLANGKMSYLRIVPFYDRTSLIKETLGTLESSLSHEIMISILVVIVLVFNIRASVIISSLLPLGVLITFISMKYFGVDANIVALSGIAIAIGVMVDVGIVFTENIIRHIELPENEGASGKELMKIVYEATVEVASAIMTALATTIVSFIPVFAMQAAEGKLFRPLAFTKTFAILSSLVVGIILVPTLAQLVFSIRLDKKRVNRIWNYSLVAIGGIFLIAFGDFIATTLILFGLIGIFAPFIDKFKKALSVKLNVGLAVLIVAYFLTQEWMPLGVEHSLFLNLVFVGIIITVVLGTLSTIVHFYKPILAWTLENKWKFLAMPIFVLLFGLLAWQGIDKTLGFIPRTIDKTGWKISKSSGWTSLEKTFPGIGKEFMPALDEGSFLLMPTTMAHSGIGENLNVIRLLDTRLQSIPEVSSVVGKWGRVASALDPAPISMYENIINYKSEYAVNEDGHRIRFKVNKDNAFVLKDGGTFNPKTDAYRTIKVSNLIEDHKGEYFRQWRTKIKNSNDIWNEIIKVARIPGLTSAPKLQPIQTRLVMLQTGMRAPMGIKVFGPTLESIEKVGLELEKILQNTPSVESSSVFADRVVGKPYLELNIKRDTIARYGLSIRKLQSYISSAIGGMPLTTTVEGRERFPVRVRYAREFRDNVEDLKSILIPTPTGVQVPLGELADIQFTRGPQMIKSENTFLVSYVIFDKKQGKAEIDVVEQADKIIKQKIANGELILPAGVSYKFTGNYENQIRATKRLMLVVPISLIVIFLILYFQFKSVTQSSMVFSGIFVAFAGGFIMLWLYGQPWFLNFSFAGVSMRDLFQLHPINLSVAVWVGFIALFGISTDDGVIMGTYLIQTFEREKPKTVAEVRKAVLHAGQNRVRPAMMTAAVAVIALIPVLTSTGKGADILVPMAIPSFGGMIIQVMTMFIVPVLYSMWQEGKVKKLNKTHKNEE